MKNKLLNDFAFLKVCRKYGLDWNKLEVFDQYIVMPSENSRIVVMLDFEYNVIGMKKIDFNQNYHSFNKYDAVQARATLYNTPTIGMPYPFQCFSQKDIATLTKRITVSKHDILFNNKLINDENNAGLMAYIKLLGTELDEYYLRVYPLIIQEFDIPDVEDYIKKVVSIIGNEINNHCTDSGKILRNLGLWYQKKDEYRYLLDLTMKMMYKARGLEIDKSKCYTKFIEIDDQFDIDSRTSYLLDKLHTKEKGPSLVKK